MVKIKQRLMVTAAVACLCSAVSVGTAYAANVQVELRDGSITPTEFQAVQDERVNISIVNRGTAVHNFVIPDYYIFTSNLQPGERTTASFEPNKTGRFAYYSDKDGVPEQGMEGHMTVG